eukprot:CAMPEP_0178924556 /NCGR_PEP_ID=MMETSP0786-20121207/17398_1 /TAXON_ID=186022 /ORGANISM="Thalassionema frauenfeldii, Strain CCMP 1798" /LENGTH=399 /DNA_ID=CAMNT_0020599291 /DNA_START=311 /DNA_END=1510 /DNA_ORIENTATION=+
MTTAPVHPTATPDYNLMIPKGSTPALPSLQSWTSSSSKRESIYGGSGDPPHLGGFTDMDLHGISPAAWHWMMEYIGIHSLLDVGCGRGISTSWFVHHGVPDVLCVEGSRDAYRNRMIPSNLIVQHDYRRGPWWPDHTYDAVWCVEFLEHVGRDLQKNYIPTFRKAALIFATHSLWGGHHHVEVHDESWWIHRMEMFGFVYSEDLTKRIKAVANEEANYSNATAPNGLLLNGQHIWHTMKVFINPAVASLPQHAHLLAEPGCYDGFGHNRECGSGEDGLNGEQAKLETKLPDEYKAIPTYRQQDLNWYHHIQARVKNRTQEGLQQIQEMEAKRIEWERQQEEKRLKEEQSRSKRHKEKERQKSSLVELLVPDANDKESLQQFATTTRQKDESAASNSTTK